jgi:ABC-type cobalamin/Fe3+-siderophores transport system ATPase subunit
MIKFDHVTSGYHGVAIIKNIELSFEEGSITGILGKNGCGKTTLLKTAAGLLKPYQGDVLLDGEPTSKQKSLLLAKRISFLPQLKEIPNMTVWDLVMHGRFPHLGLIKNPQLSDKRIVDHAIERMGLTKYRGDYLKELSGGQQQKAYLAMILAQDTDIVFLDEPTIYLDINHQLEILETIKELKNMGKTIIMVLHDLNSALTYSDRICIMDNGEVISYDTPQAIVDSKIISRIFHVTCTEIPIQNNEKQYIFSLIEKEDTPKS